MKVLDILLVTAVDDEEWAVGDARAYDGEEDDEGRQIWDVTWYVDAFEEHVSNALAQKDHAEMRLRFRPVGDR